MQHRSARNFSLMRLQRVRDIKEGKLIGKLATLVVLRRVSEEGTSFRLDDHRRWTALLA